MSHNNNSSEGPMDRLLKDYEELKRQNSELKLENEELKSSRKNSSEYLQGHLLRLGKENWTLQSRLNELSSSKDAADKNVLELEKQKRILETQLAEQKTQIEELEISKTRLEVNEIGQLEIYIKDKEEEFSREILLALIDRDKAVVNLKESEQRVNNLGYEIISLQEELSRLTLEVERDKLPATSSKDCIQQGITRKNVSDEASSSKRSAVKQEDISLDMQLPAFHARLKECGEPNHYSFKTPTDSSRHFGNVALEPEKGRCVPCQTTLQLQSGKFTLPKANLNTHFGGDRHKEKAKSENFAALQLALKLELIEEPQFNDDFLTTATVKWRITRKGEQSHYERCTNQQCDFCPTQLDLQYLEFFNQSTNIKYRLTLQDVFSCHSMFVLYFSTCLLHRYYKYIVSTSVCSSERLGSYKRHFSKAGSRIRTTQWIKHFADTGDIKSTCHSFHRMYPFAATYDSSLTYGQNVALLHANENYMIKIIGSASDLFGRNTFDCAMGTSNSTSQLGKRNPGLKYLKLHEIFEINLVCPCCLLNGFTKVSALINHLSEFRPTEPVELNLTCPYTDCTACSFDAESVLVIDNHEIKSGSLDFSCPFHCSIHNITTVYVVSSH